MATERHLVLAVTINGVMQVKLQNVSINFDSKKVAVDTMRGFAGFTPGPKSISITFDSAVSQSGPEFDPIEAAEGSDTYEVQIPIGTKTIVSQGEFMSGSLSGGVGESTKLSFEFQGTYNKPK